MKSNSVQFVLGHPLWFILQQAFVVEKFSYCFGNSYSAIVRRLSEIIWGEGRLLPPPPPPSVYHSLNVVFRGVHHLLCDSAYWNPPILLIDEFCRFRERTIITHGFCAKF
jgi:hypothetical protein